MFLARLQMAAVGLLLTGALSAPIHAAEPDIALENVKFSEPIVGEKVVDEPLRGKVVLVEIWGIN